MGHSPEKLERKELNRRPCKMKLEADGAEGPVKKFCVYREP